MHLTTSILSLGPLLGRVLGAGQGYALFSGYNPLCTLYTTLLPWVAAAIMLAGIVLCAFFAFSFLNQRAGQHVSGGILGFGLALLILGILTGHMADVASTFGITGVTWCS